MYKESAHNLSNRLLNNTEHFRKVLIEEKIAMLQAKDTLPLAYWNREKEILVAIIESRIKNFENLIESRMHDIDHKVALFTKGETPLQHLELQAFNSKWVYSMSYIFHEMNELNELKIALSHIKALSRTE